ncbi:hypothetical protein KUTeg_010022 [Tegillarca granosa]|uniref:Kinase suppressor of Ras 2 n=1 Tax=Tegillarca granosa TaxID=220873 RepID=A0ABQ9F5J1_TEGGR|nr:hypothetical protein KUTeg_010022 [Tegillarca granosa]
MSESSDTDSEAVERAIQMCTTVQDMIDVTAKHLDGLRTICATTEEITRKEIKSTESKLIKLFSKQLVAKAQLATDDIHDKLAEYPKTEQWLQVVGLKQDIVQGIMQRGITLTSLLDMRSDEVEGLLRRFSSSNDDIQKLNSALRNLKKWTERQLQGESANASDSDIELSWTSYKSTSSPYSGGSPKYTGRPSTSVVRPTTRDISSSYTDSCTPSKYTPPPTPPLPRHKGSSNVRYPSTPPPKKKLHQILEYPLTKSKSHESQLANRVTDIDRAGKKKPNNLILQPDPGLLIMRRPSNEGSDPGGSSKAPSPILTSPAHSPLLDGYSSHNTLVVPKSPKTPYSYHLSHRLSNTFKITTCDFCHKQMFLGYKCKECKFEKKMTMFGNSCDVCKKHIILNGKVCRMCKFKCHRDCATKAPSFCIYPLNDIQYYDSNYDNYSENGSPSPYRVPREHMMRNHDSESNDSSCNSSTPSSPAPPVHTYPSPGPSPQIQFTYPDVADEIGDNSDVYLSEPENKISINTDEDVVSTNTSDDSNKTLVDLSVTLKEWDIPYEKLIVEDKIGSGRFGTVYQGRWHGKVAIKMQNMDPDSDNEDQLKAFKQEVAMMIKVRHDNLILFLGACMKPPHLAIVTSYCSGQTLFNSIRKEKFPINKAIIIGQQVAQGMGYLHARGIVHKDLKTKNIFIENGKVVITDFWLFNVTKQCHGNKNGNCLTISPGWLCYLSPEIIRLLQAGSTTNDLPFSFKSDVYAFGTVWYEMMCGNWPFRKLHPQAIIWQDILVTCWAFKSDERPDFGWLYKAMERLPKKPLSRSPSHPIHLSRSVDSVFT